VLRIGSTILREQLGNISICGGTGSRDLLDGVSMLLVVQENNHGRVGDVIGTRVIDAYSVRHDDDRVLLAKKVALVGKRLRESFLACWRVTSQLSWKLAKGRWCSPASPLQREGSLMTLHLRRNVGKASVQSCM
jgi:hypothetical protein